MEKNQTTIQQQFKTYPKNERVSDDHTNLVKLVIKGPRLARQMNLNYEYIAYDYECESKKLQAPLEKLKLIDSLYISFFEVKLEDFLFFQNISMKLKSLSFLQELSLQFSYLNWVPLQEVKHLANALAQMRVLKKLMLSVESCYWINDESLHFILRSLKKSKNLQSLELDLGNCTSITEKSFKDLASIFKHFLNSLKELRLIPAGLNFTKGRPLDFLASGLAFLKDLQKLLIDFSNLQVPRGMDFSSFMLSMKHLTSLRILSLDFSFFTISGTAFKDLAKSLTSLTRLHTLSLSFRRSTTFTALEMEALAQCLQSLAPSLKNLTLCFISSQNVNDQALEKLSAGLKALTNLSKIILHCDNCLEIGDSGVKSVTEELASLPNLQTVLLNFRGCRPIKNTYHQSLKMNKSIINLHFNYDL